jgi:hypothetical protein
MSTPTDVISPITIANYGRAAWENATTYTPSLGMLREKGKIKRTSGGNIMEWPVNAGNHAAFTTGEYQDVQALYTPTTRHARAVLPWGQKAVFDGMSQTAFKKNRGDEALVDFKNDNIPAMFAALMTEGPNDVNVGTGSLNFDFLNQNGESYTGQGLPLHGLPTVFRFDNVTTGDQEAVVTAGAEYAGLSLEEGALASVDNPELRAWTPTGINTNYDWNNDASADGDLSLSNWAAVLSYAQTALTWGTAADKRPDCFLASKDYFNIGREYIRSVQKIEISRQDKGDGKWGLGNSADGFYDNGIMVYWDENMPAATGYMLNFDQIMMKYLPAIGPSSGDKYPGKKGGDLNGYPSDLVDCEVSYESGRRGLAVSLTSDLQFGINPRFQGIVKAFA